MIACSLLSGLIATAPLPAADVRLRSIDGDPASGIARAVIVDEGALVHTAMMLPEDQDGRLQGEGDPRAQAVRVLANVERALRSARTTLDSLVRLHVYVADASITPRVDALLAERFGGRARKPAVTFVESELPAAGALVAMDAIAATESSANPGRAMRLSAPGLPLRTPLASHAAIQPEGPFVVLSGRAARGEFEPAIRDTMEQLRGDLASVGLTFAHVVQVKSFLGEMRRADRLQEIVAGVFGGDRAPPQVVTEWRQDAVPAEIELVATAPPKPGGAARLEFFEPLGGRYSRVARAAGGGVIFVSGLYGRAADPVAQVDEMFAELSEILRAAGGDLRHLVKATYYVSDRRADDRINAIRPTVFAPDRPPAASKLTVRGTGRPGRGSTFDMIGLTVGP